MRIVFHIDVNNAFLSWTAVKLLKEGKKDIRKIPSVIGGDETKRHGIVLAKSPVAKKMGITSAMPLYEAKKICNNLLISNSTFVIKQSNFCHSTIDYSYNNRWSNTRRQSP